MSVDVRRIDRGRLYQPSSGSEGLAFINQFCCTCDNYRHIVPDDPDELDCTRDILTATFVYRVDDAEYPREWTHDKHGKPTCTAWRPRTKAADAPLARLCGGEYTAEGERAAYERAMREAAD